MKNMRYPELAKAVLEIIEKCDWNKAEAARLLNINASSVGYYAEGNRAPKLDTLTVIANLTGRTPSELVGAPHVKTIMHTVESPDTASILGTVIKHSRTVPVISNAQAGDFGFWEDQGEASERIACPADITDPHAFAFRVVGDSMWPRYMDGENVIVDTTKPVMNNDDVVVKLQDGAVMIKRYKYNNGMVFLESYNQTVETIPVLDGDLVKCFKIVCRK